MRLTAFSGVCLLLLATFATATETLDASVCSEAEDEYIKSIVDIDEKFKEAAEAIELRKPFFDPEEALIDGLPFGCNFEKPIYVERHSSPRPHLRPPDLIINRETESLETDLSAILREVTQSESLEASKPGKTFGVPVTDGELEKFRNQVGNCWKVDAKSRAADVVVTIAMELQPDGKVIASSLELIGFSGGNQSDANVAFQAGRRAILRCQKDGYNLPRAKYEHWRNVEITFHPSAMRR